MENQSSNMIGRIYARWLHRLAGALTPRRSGTRPWRTLLVSTPEGLEIHVKAGGLSKRVGTLAPGATGNEAAELRSRVPQEAAAQSRHVLLRLSPGDVVERTIRIPQAASDVIEPVLRNQLERMVPWPQDETRFGYRIAGPNSQAPEQLDVHLVATTRSKLESLLQRARGLGLMPCAVDYAIEPDAPHAVELMALEADPVKTTANRLHSALMVSLAASTVIGSLGLYLAWDRQMENDDLEARITVARARMEDVKRLNAETLHIKQQRERLVRRKLDEPPVIVLIEALSRTLPDSAYLTEIEIHGRETRIVGKSADPTALITKLEDSAQFRDVRFSAPTTREEGETAGTFSVIGQAEGGSELEERP